MANMQAANFTLTFGTRNLKDYLDEIVVPAFTDSSLIRTYGRTEYFLYRVEIIETLGSEEERSKDASDNGASPYAIIGHLVKNTELRRTQLYTDRGALIQNEASLQSSPSAFFVLTLRNHKLLFLQEAPFAPDLSEMRSTISKFLSIKYEEYIREQRNLTHESGKLVTLKELREIHHKPQLMILPLTTQESVGSFLLHYDLLKKIEFRLTETNQEVDGRRVWRDIRKMKTNIRARETVLVHSSKDGLNITEAIKEVHEASATGNQRVKTIGLDKLGNTLIGSNENINFKIYLPDVPSDDRKKAHIMDAKFKGLLRQGILLIDNGFAETMIEQEEGN